jgi:ATP-binding cassette subfamily F protein 3
VSLVSADKIKKAFNEQILFDNVSFTINKGERIGFVGKNGSGKTTLFDIINGSQSVDSGSVNKSRECQIDYVEQEKSDYYQDTLFDFVSSARSDLSEMRQKINLLEENLSINPKDKKSLDELGSVHNRYEHSGGFNFETEVKIILHGLGFGEERYKDRVMNFSGGEKNRAGLARVLAGKGNLLLLDEPTNHLDIESTKWLEEYLNKTSKAFIVVSHDRMFLNNTVTKVWELYNGRIDSYTGSFENYLTQRAERKRLHEHKYKHQQDRIKQLEEFVRQHMAGQKTKQAQSKLKYLARIKRLPPPEKDGMGPSIKMKSSGRSYSQVLSVEDITIGYGNNEIVENIKFDIYRGDKIGLIGQNGSGKSTLLKSLIGELAPIKGDLKLGNQVEVAYFDQELSDLNPNQTVLENLWELDPYVEVGQIRSFLGRFGFSGDDSLKMVSTLSGGEKTKLSLARLLYHPVNFIIFDEPTNHLDIVSREALEEALIEYEGSLLIVSHDRYFLNRVVNKIYHIKNSYLNIYNGNYSYFEERYNQNDILPQKKPKKQTSDYLSFKEKSKQRSKLKKEITSTKDKIKAHEKQLLELVEQIENNIPKSDWEKLQEVSSQKTNIEDELIILYEKLEQLNEVAID